MPPSEPWQGRAADYDGQRNAGRSCCACRRTYSHEEMRLDVGWEPLRRGWRCGACGRLRRRGVRLVALRMIETTEPRWSLALASPLHAASDECLPCEAVALARAMLLQRGVLARVEAEQLQAAVARWPGEATPPNLCARFGIATGLPTPPTFVLPKLPPNLDDARAESDDEASRQGPAFEEREPSADAEHNEQVDDARLPRRKDIYVSHGPDG